MKVFHRPCLFFFFFNGFYSKHKESTEELGALMSYLLDCQIFLSQTISNIGEYRETRTLVVLVGMYCHFGEQFDDVR